MQLGELLDKWIDVKQRDPEEIKSTYASVFKKDLGDCPKCISKAITELRKYYQKEQSAVKTPENGRRYILKPGNHQFVFADPALHNNENTSDTVCEWYLQKFPHLKSLFIKTP